MRVHCIPTPFLASWHSALMSLAILFTSICASAGGQEQSPPLRWGGAAAPNMTSDAKGLPADPGSTQAIWELKLGSHQYSIPTIDRGRIYLGLNDAGLDRRPLK